MIIIPFGHELYAHALGYIDLDYNAMMIMHVALNPEWC
jgi:hypothetical protein